MGRTRAAGFGAEATRRIMLGTYALSAGYYDAYYGQAQKVRTLIQRDFAAAFEQADVLISPTAPTTAFKLGEKLDDPLAMYLNDVATIPANLAGTPGMSLPIGLAPEDGLPVGLQIMAPGHGRRPALQRRRRARGGAAGPVGPPPPRGGSGAVSTHTTEPVLPYDEVVARVRPGARARGARRARHRRPRCSAAARPGSARRPTRQVCPVCLGLPGCAARGQRGRPSSPRSASGSRCNCSIAQWCRFARKNYFYPDMPKNFQTSQYDEPIAFDGYLDVDVETDEGMRTFRVEIERAHMEEDTGKTTHQGGATGRIHGADYSLVDYNRAGIPLIEIVTKPVPGTGKYAPEVARAYVTALRELLRGLGVSDVKMEQGSLRCDANVSLRASADAPLGHPHRDQERQLAALGRARRALRDDPAGRGARVRAAAWCRRPGTGTRTPASPRRAGRSPTPRTTATSPSPTSSRSRRRASGSSSCAPTLPENPAVRQARLKAALGHQRLRAWRRWSTRARSTSSRPPSRSAPTRRAARKWWIGELARIANEQGVELVDLAITPADVARVEALVGEGALNDKLARQVIEGVLAGEGTPDEVVAARGLAVVSDDGPLLAAIDEALAAQPDVAEKIRGGKVAAAGAIVGAVMKATRGQADAARVRDAAARAPRRHRRLTRMTMKGPGAP